MKKLDNIKLILFGIALILFGIGVDLTGTFFPPDTDILVALAGVIIAAIGTFKKDEK